MPNYPTLIPKTSTPTPETLPGGGIQLPALSLPTRPPPSAYRRLAVAAALQLSRLVRHHAKSKPFLQERIDPGSPG